MGNKLHERIEVWKKQLLDLGKRNKLINFLESKRGNVKITSPYSDILWERIVVKEQALVFPYAINPRVDEDGNEKCDKVIEGDLQTNKTYGELQKTLKVLRNRANQAIEELGVNILYLTFGMLKWKEREDSTQEICSPLILVPVRLLVESLTSPYRLALHEDEIIVNPTLAHKLNNDFGIVLPDFDSVQSSPNEYFNVIASLVEKNNWAVDRCVYLAQLSFLKINMYKDLEKNEDRLVSNPIISALAGESILEQDTDVFRDIDHDKQTRPIDIFQVMDADSSQQDAIMCSKKGLSFVLQGPPGTGKSQTITNIIAEAIADGKKVLFVSEKMAALQVVYKNLEKVGLADFCLTLHNHKANKKDILRELENSTHMDKTRIREEVMERLDMLENKRKLLNDYQEELHTSTSELDISIFQAYGKLAKMENVPDVVFQISDVDKVTKKVLEERRSLLDELSKNIDDKNEENVWRNTTISSLTSSLTHDIDAYISEAHPLVIKLAEQLSAVCEKLGISFASTLKGVDELISFLDFVAKSPFIPSEWLIENDVDSLISLARNSQEKLELFVVDTEALNSLYDERFFEIDAEKCKKELLDAMSQLQLWFREDDCNLLSLNIAEINDELIKLSEYFNFVCDYAERLASVIGVEKPGTVEEIVDFAESIQVLADIYNTHPSSKWFDRNELFRIKQHFDHIESLHNELNGLRNSVLSLFDKEILEIDFPSDLLPVLQRFREDYKSSIGRLFNRDFHNDMKLLKLKSKDGNLSYKGALDVLNNLKYIWDLKTEIDENASQYRDDYGCLYTGLDTKWDLLQTNLEVFEKSIARLPIVTPVKLSKAIQEGQLASVIEKFTQLDSEFDLTSAFEKIETYLRSDITKATPCNELIGKIETANALSEDFISKQQRLMDMRKAHCSFGVLISDLETLDSRNRLKDEISKQHDVLSGVFKNYYCGVKTDWEKLVRALNVTGEFRNLKERYILSDAAVRYFCEDTNAREYCGNECKKLSKLLGDARKSVEWFISLFKDGQAFYDYNLWDLAKRMTLCREKKHLLEVWIDYGISRKKCFEAGLGEYIEKVEELGLARRYVKDAYIKRFYRLWLDAVLPKFPAVQNFRGRAHAQNIADFRTLDKDQFKIAQSRIRERVISRIPDFNQLNNAKDEIAILRKELNKQRRLMPLRKLFTAIPNLLTTLRPCFMMSPLSVSVFLEAQSYEFDLVIFDEASQVQTEDAVGAIMRAKQVIIVGDTKQLPPTSFFLKANNDEYDLDMDEAKEDNDVGAFESILEEAAAIMPEQSLRWHYRSRHEHLIAFSNIKIYNGRLMTFPSSTEKGPDTGVEYVYVKDGIYGGQSGRNSNMVEAQKVADLVFEHFEKHPERSLGVVTFSEHQQDAIERVIHQRRLNNQRYDGFFNEDRSEPFFVKNLENVQGDERDTIIFSIGYAKNRVGKMSMNFGPLNKEGGFRRLNVAITRAKHNLKLVGSIQPADINLDNVKSEGPKLLRSYIEFAQQGIAALDNEISSSSEVIWESPFEEAVYVFLVDKGYNVVTQVGCSSYRIDLAIKHPKDSGKYVIGIECDGATYHSSRTARERDRLRQTILEKMGWTIYRIWSTDWIKNKKTEEEKLVNAIECALNGVKVECDDCENPESYVPPIGDIEEKIESHNEEICGTEYGFEFYERATVNPEWDVKDKLSEIISKEHPIKFEELCKRIAPAFGRQKATSVVRNSVKEIMQKELMDDFIEDRNGFIWLANDTDMKVRVPNPDDPDSVRSIELICNEELALAMKTIVRKSIGITRDDLFAATKREFGFKHTGDRIKMSLNEVYRQMVDNSEIVELDGKIKIV